MKRTATGDGAGDAVRAVAAGLARAQRGGACPEATAIAAFAEGKLAPAAQRQVEAHLAGCDDCRGTVATLLLTGESEVVRQRPWAVARWLLAAAGLLIGLAVVAWATTTEPREVRLVAALTTLRRDAAAAVGDFELLSPAELAQRPDPVRGGGTGLWIHPAAAGVIHDVEPAIVLCAVEPANAPPTFHLRVLDALDGTLVGEGNGRFAVVDGRLVGSWPLLAALQRGASYALRLSLAGGATPLDRNITLASEAAATSFDRGAEAIAAHATDDVGVELAAHWALRRGFLREAEVRVMALQQQYPQAGAITALLRHVRARLGLPEQD